MGADADVGILSDCFHRLIYEEPHENREALSIPATGPTLP